MLPPVTLLFPAFELFYYHKLCFLVYRFLIHLSRAESLIAKYRLAEIELLLSAGGLPRVKNLKIYR